MNDIYSFYQLISRYHIEIPIIQRDYAQGRNNAKTADIRKSIISSFVKAVQDKDSEPLFLDFVYGRIEGNTFIPFDGQQRLTTLFLFHKYIFEQCQSKSTCVHKDHCICKDIIKGFSYSTRQSSREFCELLVDKRIIPNYGTLLSKNIMNQSWFFPDWKKDPTIMGMLTMLDEIHGQLKDKDEFKFKYMSERLTSGCTCPISFHFVDMGEHKLSDETYVKMNARGKNLTPFENFKASLEQYLNLKNETDLQNRFKGKYDDSKKKYTGIDGIWLDKFWDEVNRDKDEKELPDSRIMSFFNRHFMNVWRCWYKLELDKERKYLSEQDEETLKNHNYFNERITKMPLYPSKDDFVSWDIYQHILDNCGVKPCLNPIFNILDILCEASNNVETLSQAVWNRENDNINKWNLFQGYINNNNRETYPSRVVFYALLLYFDTNYDEKTLSQWMRIVWNIVENSTIDSPESYSAALCLIEELSTNSHEINVFLSDENTKIKSNHAQVQVKEEIAKAKQILYGKPRSDGESWEDVIIEAEKTAFFKGAIRFLFQDANGHPNWDDFDIKWMNAKKYFDADGVKDDENSGVHYKTDAILLKAVLFHVKDFWSYIECHKFVFDNKGNTWKSNILLEQGWELAVHKIMMNDHHVIERNDDCLMYKDLYNSNLLNYVAMHQINSRINWIHGHRALYPPRYEGILLDDDKNGFYRNRILFGLLTDNLIKTNHKIECCDFFKGWDVNFYYIKDEKQFEFQWNTDNHVYLIENGKWVVKDNTTDEKYEKYLCFDVSTIKEKDVFLSELNNLISK